jgi:hypothetical protein
LGEVVEAIVDIVLNLVSAAGSLEEAFERIVSERDAIDRAPEQDLQRQQHGEQRHVTGHDRDRLVACTKSPSRYIEPEGYPC